MHAMLILAASGMLLAGQPPEKAVEKTPAPAISKDLENEFWKRLSAYHSINADLQEALKKEAVDRQLLEDQRKLVTESENAIRAACGPDHELDEQEFRQKGKAGCVAKKKTEAKPKVDSTEKK
jgi:hypothetical protein